jgi:hypothetical protein|tara:strand:- start:2252 stop:2482 length:231 start_codon:yes stop_codon:yes gene_type:complete
MLCFELEQYLTILVSGLTPLQYGTKEALLYAKDVKEILLLHPDQKTEFIARYLTVLKTCTTEERSVAIPCTKALRF